MRGTGSKDVSLVGAFVPEHRWIAWSMLQAGGRHADAPGEEPLSGAALTPVNALSVLVPTIGVASALAEEFRALAAGRSSLATATRMREDKVAQIEAATGEAAMAMLRTQLLADAALIEARAGKRRALSLEERAAMRMRFALMSRQALAASQRMLAHLGGSLLPSGTRIERAYRDLTAMSTHFLLQPEPAGEAYGRLLLGLELPPGARL
jgi:3-hydroxy-9,10-secoandrosta-1,3,5(10)-triene-9,17-dione monooxygenase